MRDVLIAGNWKMNYTRAQARQLLDELHPLLDPDDRTKIVICPPFTALHTVEEIIQGTEIMLGAQDVFWKDKGAYTGQISPTMLHEVGCTYVIIGHSERRGRFGVPEPDFDEFLMECFGDNDMTVNRKLLASLHAGLLPICCVGETLAEREAGQTDSVVTIQVENALRGVTPEEIGKVVFAYEPVWAIGTGRTCAPDEADRVCGLVRSTVGRLYGAEAAENVIVQYGGSVKPDNARELLSRPNIDGALVGGASLKAHDFALIVAAGIEV